MRLCRLEIQNFRSIRNLVITDISNAIAFVGKNNAGKSAIINGIRTFWGDYELKSDDFHKNQSEFQITTTFTLDDDYYTNFVYDSKIGVSKIPSTASEFNVCKIETEYETVTHANYKEIVSQFLALQIEPSRLLEEHPDIFLVWKRGLESRFGINNNQMTITAKATRDNPKISYLRSDDEKAKDVEQLFPLLAFIDDDRRFNDEENGKVKTLTGDLFGNHILKKGRATSDQQCNSCFDLTCTDCLAPIYEKRISELNLNDLEKLTKNKVAEISATISATISDFFSKNYKEGYKIDINPKSNIDKSFSINTKIFDPNLGRRVDLSNVGAGLRSIYILSLLQAYHDLCDNNNIIFLVEEPEIYLHPSLQKLIGNILHDISNKNQVFFTTHSPLVLKNLEASQVRKIEINEDYETRATNTILADILNELGYSTEDIIDTEFVIFVEGKDDKERLKAIISKYYTIDPSTVFIVDTKSCSNIETYATLQFLNKTNLVSSFLIFRDSDTQDRARLKQSIINKLRENLGAQYDDNIQNHVLVLTYSAFDNYFLNPDTLVTLRVVRDYPDYEEKINSFLARRREYIKSYLVDKNGEQRAGELENLIYRSCPLNEKIEDVKKYVRGHDLFGIFGGLKSKTQRYIQLTTQSDFDEITNHLNTVSFFRDRHVINRQSPVVSAEPDLLESR